jgi:hypothetical protein
LIGNLETKFCIKGKECTTVTHSIPMHKHSLTPGIYILDLKTKSCFITPAIEGIPLDSQVVDHLLTFKGDFESTHKEFVFIKSQDGGLDAKDIYGYVCPNLSKTVVFKTP